MPIDMEYGLTLLEQMDALHKAGIPVEPSDWEWAEEYLDRVEAILSEASEKKRARLQGKQ